MPPDDYTLESDEEAVESDQSSAQVDDSPTEHRGRRVSKRDHSQESFPRYLRSSCVLVQLQMPSPRTGFGFNKA